MRQPLWCFIYICNPFAIIVRFEISRRCGTGLCVDNDLHQHSGFQQNKFAKVNCYFMSTVFLLIWLVINKEAGLYVTEAMTCCRLPESTRPTCAQTSCFMPTSRPRLTLRGWSTATTRWWKTVVTNTKIKQHDLFILFLLLKILLQVQSIPHERVKIEDCEATVRFLTRRVEMKWLSEMECEV